MDHRQLDERLATGGRRLVVLSSAGGHRPSQAKVRSTTQRRQHCEAVRQSQLAVHIDETSWRRDRKKVWLWATVTALATVFTIARDRFGAVAKACGGPGRSGRHQRPVQRLRVDRRGVATGLLGPPPARLSGDDRPGGRGGGDRRRTPEVLPRLSRAWHRVRDGTTAWASFPRSMRDLRRRVRATLGRGSKCPCAPTSATCWEILKVEEGLWTFSGSGGRVDEQRGGAGVAACRDLATDQRRHGQRAGQPVRRAHADDRGDLPPARPQPARFPDLVLRGSTRWSRDTLATTCGKG